ncbi:MAG: DUF3159 domain-containing protein [Actinomycetota bacterium]
MSSAPQAAGPEVPGLGVVPPGLTTVEDVVRHHISESLGGWRGGFEAAVPTIAFLVSWTTTHNIRMSLIAAGSCIVLAIVTRLMQQQTPKFALGSVFGLVLAAVLALRSGRAEDVFLPGILYSGAALAVTLLSVFTRWPVVGFLLAAAQPERPFAWRSHSGVVRLCQRLSLVFAGLFAIRLLVMAPLYAAGQVTWLGIAKIALGWPLYLVALLVAGALLVRGDTPLTEEDPRQ